MEKRVIAGLLQNQDTVVEEHQALQASTGGLSDLLEDCLTMDEATDKPMAIDKDGHLVAQALTASAKIKDQAEASSAWECDIAC